MADAPTINIKGSLRGTQQPPRATPPPLPPRRAPPPLPDSLGPGGVPRRLLKDVVTLPPMPREKYDAFTGPEVMSARTWSVAPPPPKSQLHVGVLAALLLSVSGAFAAGMWTGRAVERQHQAEVEAMALPVAAHPRVAPPILLPPVAPEPELLLPYDAPALTELALRAVTEADERPWNVAGEGGVTLQQPPRTARRERQRPHKEARAPVVRLADQPFESPLPEEGEEDREVAALVDALPGVSPKKAHRLDVVDRPSTVWLPPALEKEELPETLSREAVLAVLLDRKDELVDCVREQQTEGAEQPHGTLTVRWRIRPEGSTAGIVVESPELRDTGLARCATQRIAAWSFPAHRQKMGPVRVPFAF